MKHYLGTRNLIAFFMGFVVLLAVGLLSGCSKRPEEKISSVKEKLEYFSHSHSDDVQTKTLLRIIDLKDRAKLEIEAQDSRFALFRSYVKGAQLLDSLSQLIDTYDYPEDPPAPPPSRLLW